MDAKVGASPKRCTPQATQFDARCVKTMSHITPTQSCVCNRYPQQNKLRDRTCFGLMDKYTARWRCQLLRWLGYVIRMPFDRFTPTLLSSWLPYKRPKVCHGDDLRPKTMIKTHAKTFDLDPKHWSAMAANRTTYIFTLASQDQMIAVSQGVSFDDDTRHVSATSHLEIWFPCPTLPNLFLCVLYPLCTFLVESMLQFRSWSITNYYIVYILI